MLRREAESNKQMYETLMQRAKETGISGELKTSNIRIVDQAEVPRSPVSPNKSRDFLLGSWADDSRVVPGPVRGFARQ